MGYCYALYIYLSLRPPSFAKVAVLMSWVMDGLSRVV